MQKACGTKSALAVCVEVKVHDVAGLAFQAEADAEGHAIGHLEYLLIFKKDFTVFKRINLSRIYSSVANKC